ncbi:MAG TPA: PA2779 family protein [Burkholderiales bacterium]|nr:PA2779 family protein [Burkholderiales bacterium]
MNTFFRRLISCMLIFSLAGLPFTAQAGLIATDEVANPTQLQPDREKVRDFVLRADVQQQLQERGLTPQNAKERVDALTDTEIQHIAGRIDTLPAGADGGTAAVVGITLLVILITYVILRLVYPQK